MQTTLKISCQSPEEATIIIEILNEIRHAVVKHPTWPRDAVSRAAIVAEEAGEVIREANHIREGHGDVKALRLELIQTAGTCIRMLNIMDSEKHTAIPVFEQGARVKGKGLAAYFPGPDEKRRFSKDNQ
jgi:NTP pyrophosphatase (non-canonical NTP hydrolase)